MDTMPIMPQPLSWEQELDIIDRTMRGISSIGDPEELVSAYFEGIGDLLPVNHYVSVSRRDVPAPYYLITRSSRFTEHVNPWTHRHLLPRHTGGLLGEIAYANQPVIIDDLPSRLADDDPCHFYLQGFQQLVSLPNYDAGQGLNVTTMLMEAGNELPHRSIPMLHWQSALFGRGTQSLVLKNQLSKALAMLDKELQVVGEIQRGLLPQTLPDIPGVELSACYKTSARAGGDYYDFFRLADGGWGIFIADVSGHGTPAAVLMAITHAIAHAQPGTHTPPASLLTYLNDRLVSAYTREGTFVTGFYAVYDPHRRTLTYSIAGHNPPRLSRGGHVLSLDRASSLPLGLLPDQLYHEAMIQLEPNDLLLLYTDGITEAMAPRVGDGAHELFGVDRLDSLLTGCSPPSAEGCLEMIQKAVATFTHDAPPKDDQTLIAMKLL